MAPLRTTSVSRGGYGQIVRRLVATADAGANKKNWRYELSYNTCVSYNHTFTDRAPAVTPATPLCQATDSDFQSVEPNRTVQQAIAPEEAQPVSAEDRQNADGSVTSSPRVSSLFENPAGVIGSPVKGKGGAYSCRGLDSTSPWKR
ncbi:unnamed protein product [Heligmosomoides polygyrus]|uniref:Uncharacterized protein n=1 Tax=Heligmosomoides polygyrus TaxID=6339 RepID=A0A3P8AQS8_HELPZ|nr:unnamed protein product [Heligmosomoides polygyrus]